MTEIKGSVRMESCMKIAMISFTKQGEELADKLAEKLTRLEIENKSFRKPFQPAIGKVVEDCFTSYDGILFIGAAGIAVRCIAPYIKSKFTDPAVVVMDERGKYCISLLSGHIGGANGMTKQIASITGAIPVITTATDINDCFAIDLFAKEKNLLMAPTSMCKEISAALLNKEKVMVKSDFPITSSLPAFMELEESVEIKMMENTRMDKTKEGQKKHRETTENSYHIHFALFQKSERTPRTLYLIPKVLTIGIGCRKGASYEKIENAVVQSLKKLGGKNQKNVAQILQSTAGIASIDVKEEEPGIQQFVRKYQLPFVTFSAEELGNLDGNFSHSDFVEQTVGVDNVCERAAVKACPNGTLIGKKATYDGVTVAIVMSDWSVDFV